MAESSGEAPGGSRRHAGSRLKEKTMELKDLISELERILDRAGVAAAAGDESQARGYLRAAKQLLDDEFIKD